MKVYKDLFEYRKYLAEDNRWAFLDKWDYGFSALREDIIDIMSVQPDDNILDIGCADGKTLAAIKENYKVNLYGVEPDSELASEADKYGKIFNGTIEAYLKICHQEFDAIIMADVIEHLKEPWAVVREVARHMADNGALYASIPNYFHATVMYNLFECGSFGYASNDIVNKEHIRFFTLNDSINLLKMAGLEHFEIYGNHVPSNEKSIETAQKLQDLFKKDFNFDVYQFVIKATKES